jgi:hypothetical protein
MSFIRFTINSRKGSLMPKKKLAKNSKKAVFGKANATGKESPSKKVGRFVYWTPRILSILYICFFAFMSLDAFSSGLDFWGTAGALLMHNIPTFVLIAVLIVAWRYEIVGGIAFFLAGLVYIGLLANVALKGEFEFYMIAWAIQISGFAFFIGIFFLMNWYKKKR